MDVNAFHGVLAGLSFTLLGLWWVASRLQGRVQLTTDGHRPYLDAVERAFGRDVD